MNSQFRAQGSVISRCQKNSPEPANWRCTLLLAAFAAVPADAGEIPGLRPQLPPFLARDLEVVFSNDFLGRGGSVDDFRTQQIIINAKISDRWIAVLDNSILTLTDSPTPGRIDQLSGSLGYQVINTVDDQHATKLAAGIGIRSVGNFEGQRMQNGFHRLVGSDVDILPYTDTSRTDATAWFDADHYRQFGKSGEGGLIGNWRTGYWLRASSLLTSGGQWDSSAGLFAVASKPGWDLWLGLRRDWRSGYDDRVLQETAAAEDDLAVVFGARFGALVLETVQQLNNDASYGQLRLVSSGVQTSATGNNTGRLGLEAGFLLPNIQLRLAGRYRIRLVTNPNSKWRESVIVTANYGEPQHEDNAFVFVRSRQLDVGLDFERAFSEHPWISTYVSAGVGWRTESLIGVEALAGESSGSVGSAILSAGTGLRVDAGRLGQRWNYRITLGLTGRLPIKDANLQIGAALLPVLEPALDLMLGITFDFN